MLNLKKGLWLTAAAAAAAAAWATLIEPRLFTVRRHTLPLLAAGATPLRVLQLSDLHLAPWQRGKIGWVQRLARLNPDLLLLTGDLLGHAHAIEPLREALSTFAANEVPGAFVHGSNDYFSPVAKNPLVYFGAPSSLAKRSPDLDTSGLTRALETLGFTDLNNRATSVTLRGSTIELYGLGDPHIHYDDASRLSEAIAALPSHTAAPRSAQPSPVRLGVVHAPYRRALDALLAHQVEAIFAGHTHGGQIRFPGVGALTANCDLPLRQARGLSVWHNNDHAAFLTVSAGLGASIYAPFRFGCRPEASLVTLEAARLS